MYQEPMNVDGPECGGAIHAGIYGAGVNKATSTVLQIGAERVRALNQTIQNIQAVKKYLHLNSVEVKSSIHSTVSRLLESLRNREVWLLNQVDLVYQAKEEVLRRQEDKLNQAVGGLTNCIDLIETGSASEDELLAYLGSISTMDKHAEETPHISFRFDMLSLRDAIQKFGKVDSKGLSLPGAPFSLPCLEMTGGYGCVGVKDGSSLPRQFEEYGDDEHQILYKTVSSGVNRSSEDSIFVNIPRLSDNTKMAGGINTYQMSDAAGSRTTALKGSRSSGVLENLLGEQETRMSRTSSLRQWLTDLTAHCDDDDGMMTESKLVNMACSQSSTDDNAAATSSTVGSAIEIRISAPDGDNDSEGGLNAVGGAIDSKVELFEGFRRICQRPLSDWLSKACAVIDSHCDQSKTAASLKYTLSIFQKVINSPFQEWLHASRSSANSSVSVAAWEPVNCVVDKIIDKHTATVREATRRKWLSEARSEADGMISHDSQIDSCGDSAVISQDKNQPLNDVHAKNGVLFCPFRSYVRKLEQQPIDRWLTDGEAAGDGFSVSAGSQPNVYSPLAEYMRHCASLPSSYWLASSASKQETDGSNGSPGGLNNYNTKDAVSKEFEANLAGRRVSSVPLSDNGMAWYDIGSKFVHCPISQWLQQTSNANNLPENNIGSRIASMSISDWLKLTNEKYLMHASDNVDCDLKEQMEHSTLSDSCKSLAGDAVVLSKNLNKEVSDNYSHMTESLEELHMNDTEDLSCNGELDSLLASSFVEIIQDNTDDIVSASIALPAVFGQPVQYWHAQELRSDRCDDTALSQQSMNIGKSVLDGYALMQVSEWLGH